VLQRPTARYVSQATAAWMLTTSLLVASALIWLWVRGEAPPLAGGRFVPLSALAVGFGLAEVFVMQVRIASHAQTFSLAEIPLVFGLIFVSPGELVLAQTIGMGVALALCRRQKPVRLTFNVAQRAFTTLAAVVVMSVSLSALPAGWPALWIAVFGAMLVADVIGGMLINVAIGLSDNKFNLFDQVFGVGTALTVANTAVGILAVMAYLVHPASVLLMAASAATTYLAGKTLTHLQRKHDDLVQLQRATGLAQRSLKREDMISELLQHMRGMFNAEIAEVLLWPEEPGEPLVRCQIGQGDDRTEFDAVSPNAVEGVWARVAAQREAVLLARPIRNDALRRVFGERRIRDAIVAPICSDDQLLGIITVADRLGDFTTFDEGDVEMLRTLANHVAVALRNSLLLDRLERALTHETAMNRLKDDFVAMVSHELQTPVTNIQGFVKTLLRRDVRFAPREQEEFLMRADRQSDRLRHLIEDLLFASRIESTEEPRPSDVIGLAGLITRVVCDETDGDERKRIDIVFPSRLPPIAGVEEDVYRIVRILVVNGLKYSPPDARVTITGVVEADDVVIRVRDRGSGIDPAERERIFDRFYQVDQSSTRRVGGIGMGLYVCRRAAERLGGSVWLDRSDASGSVFAVRLPIGDDPAGPALAPDVATKVTTA
jgi:signal transduction histidine kinase